MKMLNQLVKRITILRARGAKLSAAVAHGIVVQVVRLGDARVDLVVPVQLVDLVVLVDRASVVVLIAVVPVVAVALVDAETTARAAVGAMLVVNVGDARDVVLVMARQLLLSLL
ncbi:MAG TPA: hypothetical protein DEA90_06200 [Opitutae bacterium]|nr:hypothetical protein [Puniceicoccaceae bacterium]HBR93738.1 hypothetical protein [Opitutae bacterium]